MEDRTSERFNDSFERCMAEAEFFDRFYERFLEVGDEVASRFEKTDFARQKRVLKRSLYQLMLFASNGEAIDERMENLAERHSRTDLDIRPNLYAVWLDCLVETARSCDPGFDEATERAWRTVLQPGIDFLTSRY